jgi:hypothetical protein
VRAAATSRFNLNSTDSPATTTPSDHTGSLNRRTPLQAYQDRPNAVPTGPK